MRARTSDMPEELEVEAVFLVRSELENGLVLFTGDALAAAIFYLGPGTLGENGTKDPLKIESPIVKDPELDVGGDSSPRMSEDFHEV